MLDAPPESRLPTRSRKGRGAVTNATGRFEPHSRAAFDDGWGTQDEEPPQLRTTVTEERPKTVITKNNSPDVPFDISLNPYRGCEHGCVYCFARPTHAYQGLSPGLDFESKLFAKPGAPEILAKQLRNPRYKVSTLAMGTNTDPYQPIERDLKITRRILEVLEACNHPVAIVTKSNLILRDLDILAPMAEKGLASVGISVTSMDRKLSRLMEPRAPTPARRISAIRALVDAGVPVAAMVAPIVPAINDHEIENILAAVSGAGAEAADYILLRLPLEVKDLFIEWLETHYPDRAKKALSRMAGQRGGRMYEAQWGTRMRGTGPFADLLAKRFQVACKQLGINQRQARERRHRTDLFERPLQAGDQLSLF